MFRASATASPWSPLTSAWAVSAMARTCSSSSERVWGGQRVCRPDHDFAPGAIHEVCEPRELIDSYPLARCDKAEPDPSHTLGGEWNGVVNLFESEGHRFVPAVYPLPLELDPDDPTIEVVSTSGG
jgi:hypothetical protein